MTLFAALDPDAFIEWDRSILEPGDKIRVTDPDSHYFDSVGEVLRADSVTVDAKIMGAAVEFLREQVSKEPELPI